MRYRKKPIEIEAYRIENNALVDAFPEWLIQAHKDGIFAFVEPDKFNPHWVASVETDRGKVFVNWGDWIIKGVNGELYPCAPDIFEETYEPVDESHN